MKPAHGLRDSRWHATSNSWEQGGRRKARKYLSAALVLMFVLSFAVPTPAMAQEPEDAKCNLPNAVVCQLLDTTGGGGGGVCLLICLPLLCSPQDLAKVGPAEDFDGDGLGNLFEVDITRVLAGRGINYDPCVANSDEATSRDAVPDGFDLVQGGQLPTAPIAVPGLTRQTGVEVSATLERWYQTQVMDDPFGDGDPWFGLDSFLGTGNIRPGTGGGAKIAFESMMIRWHWHDREFKERGRWKMIDPLTLVEEPVSLSEDVRQWLSPSRADGRFTDLSQFSSTSPQVGLALLPLDHDGAGCRYQACMGSVPTKGPDQAGFSLAPGCENETYFPEDDLRNCGTEGDLISELDTVDLIFALFDAPGAVADVANNIGSLPERCASLPGFRACFTVQIHDDGRRLDNCTMAIATAGFRRHHGLAGAPSGILTTLPPDLAPYCPLGV
jgi:hypothetical protein